MFDLKGLTWHVNQAEWIILSLEANIDKSKQKKTLSNILVLIITGTPQEICTFFYKV